MPLYGIVHEDVGVQEFKAYLQGEFFLDEKVINYSYMHQNFHFMRTL